MPLKTLPKPLVFLTFGALGSLLGWIGSEGIAKLAPAAPQQVVTSAPLVREVQPGVYRRENPGAVVAGAPSMLFEPEVQRRLDAAGASATGDIKIALSWESEDDLDLHCFEPGGSHIFFGRKVSGNRGELDVDQNARRPYRRDPVEHIFWPSGKAPAGEYRFFVHRFAKNSSLDEVPFQLNVAIGDMRRQYTGKVSAVNQGMPQGEAVLTFKYELAPTSSPPATEESPLIGILMVAGTLGMLSVGIAFAVCSVQGRLLGRGSWIPSGFGKLVLFGVAGGVVAGAVGQGLLSLLASSDVADQTLLKSVAWMVAGAILGFGFSRFIPNLETKRAMIAGVLGGLVAALLVGAPVFGSASLARLAACLAMGSSTGLAIALVESMAREGFIRVHWAPNEVTTVNLGARPVSVGTGPEATIRIPRSTGYPALVADFRIELGKATMHHHMTGATHPLRDGNKLVLGPVTLEVKLFS